MVSLATFGVGILMLAIVVARRLWRSPVAIICALSFLPLLGFDALIRRHGAPDDAAIGVYLFPVFLLLGAAVAGQKRPASSDDVMPCPKAENSAMTVSILVLAGSALHFALLGNIPALSSNVEVDRFTFNSGLGGIPGRLVLFGLPLLVLTKALRPELFSPRLTAALWAAFVASRLALGFKGGIFEVFFLLLFALALRAGPVPRRAVTVMTGFLAFGFIYAAVVAQRYGTLAGDQDFVRYVIDRATVLAAEPGYVALELRPFLPNFVVNDLQVFSGRYLGLDTDEVFAIDQRVSAVVTGTQLTQSAFIVPVTLGGGTYLIGALGSAYAALVTASIMGFAVQRAGTIQAGRPSFLAALLCASVVLALRDFALNGGGVYVLVNYLAVTSALALTFKMASRRRSL